MAELGLLLVADRLLERDRRSRGELDRLDLARVDAGHVGDLLGRRLSAERRGQAALGPADLVQLLDDVDRDPDRARFISESAGDRLTDPPGRVGRELEPLAVVELLRRADKTDRALLDQVEKRQPLVAVVLRDRDDQPQVRLDHLLFRVQLPALDPLGEIDLLLGAQQPHLADALHQQLKGIGGHVGLEVKRGLGLAPTALVGDTVHLRRRVRGIDLFDELDLGPLEEAVQLLDVGLVEVELGRGGLDLGVCEHAELLAACDQALDLFKLLKFRC